MFIPFWNLTLWHPLLHQTKSTGNASVWIIFIDGFCWTLWKMADFLIGKSRTKGQLLVKNLSTSLGHEPVVGWSHSILEVTSQLYRRCVWKMKSHYYPWTEATRQVEQSFSFKILRLHHCWSAVLQFFTYIRGIDGTDAQRWVRKGPYKS